MKDHLTQTSLLRLVGVMSVVLLPHFWHVPSWEIIFILAVLGWRTLAVLRQWQLPQAMPRLLITVVAAAGVFASYGRLNGQNAGTALISVMCALKLLEMRSRRDVMVTVFLMYFVLMTHFLISQEIWTVAYLLVCSIGITAFLIEASHASVGTPEPLPLKLTLRMGAVMIGYSLPLMLLMFVLFPRIPGPLWGLPSDSGALRSGLPDSMSPGNIAQLIMSDELAFRVRFDGPAPPMRERYWRGPIFDAFDGRSWTTGARFDDPAPAAEFRGEPVRYEVTLEPTRTTWLLALDLPSPRDLPSAAYINSDHQLVAREKVRERRLYRAASYLQYTLQPDLLPRLRLQNLRLPRYGNSGAQTLAHNWRAGNLSDEQIVQRALKMFHEEKFYYTLRPPTLGEDSIDDFLFHTRKGFCEHYASSFTYLMRAAGIPARVIAGYMGGVKNQYGDYYIVSQSDAHAWSEVWLAGKGWVRVDPTGAVSPSRIESGIESALGAAGELPDFLQRRGNLWGSLEARWDWVDNQWNHWVLAYGPELQGEFLSKFGIHDWSEMVLALTIIGTLTLAIIGGLLLRQYRPADNADAALKLWLRACSKLAKRGIVQRPHEGPRDFAQRVADEEPELGPAMRELLSAYLQVRYIGDSTAGAASALKAAVIKLP